MRATSRHMRKRLAHSNQVSASCLKSCRADLREEARSAMIRCYKIVLKLAQQHASRSTAQTCTAFNVLAFASTLQIRDATSL